MSCVTVHSVFTLGRLHFKLGSELFTYPQKFRLLQSFLVTSGSLVTLVSVLVSSRS